MSLKLGVVMDPIGSIHYRKDTTLALLWAAQDRGWALFYIEPDGLFLDAKHPTASARPITVHRNADHWFDLGDKTALRRTELDVVLMRKDPPFDLEYIYATYILERAEQEGTLVVNRCHCLLYTSPSPRD